MPLDEGDRRRALEEAAFAGSNGAVRSGESLAEPVEAYDGQQGTVISLSNNLYRVEVGNSTLLCSVRGTLVAQETGFTNPVAVGDQVIVREDGAGGGVVENVLPRRSMLVRPDVFYSHLRQVVVSNVDQLLIVASWRDPIIWFELIDRYLIAAARNELPPVLCVNKIDLAEGQAEYEEALQPYHKLKIPILFTSAETGHGIDALRGVLRGRTTVLAGLSGVGKSTLLSVVKPGLDLRTGVISERKGEGRHTTTQAELIRLDSQTTVVDTPGIREFGLSGLAAPELVTHFPEIADAAAGCRFRNCTHHDEPDCAVRAAAKKAEIAQSRYYSYQKIYAELT
jgi:ribosome biogenesis GTPase